MLRGAEKRMIVVRTRDSRLFEEAYFVVRPEADKPRFEESDMLLEANRLLENSMTGARAERGARELLSARGGFFGGLLRFTLGLLTGGGAVGLLWVLLG